MLRTSSSKTTTTEGDTAHTSRLLFVLVLLLLTIATWAIGLLDSKYNVIAELAFSDGFPGNAENWQMRGVLDNVELQADGVQISRQAPGRSYAKSKFELPATVAEQHRLRVRGEIKTIVADTDPVRDHLSALMVWFLDDVDEPFLYRNVVKLTGKAEVVEAERIVEIPSTAQHFMLAMVTSDGDGTFLLQNLSADVIEVSFVYKTVSTALIVCWALFSLMLLAWLIKSVSISLILPIVILCSLIVVGVLIPESVTYRYVLPLFDKLSNVTQLHIDNPVEILFKLGHFLFFLLMSLFVYLNLNVLKLRPTIAFIILFLFALATEGLQLHLFDRTTRWSDILIDASGILLGLILAFVITRGKLTQSAY